MAGTTTILFTDLVSSTESLERLGDDDGVRGLTAHLALVRQVVEAAGGTVAKSLGDGVMALFDSAYDAVRAAVSIQQQVYRRSDGDALLRIGVNVGEVIAEADDVFGAAVVVARRLCEHAEGGRILVSDLVRALVGSRGGFEFSRLGRVELKGLSEPAEAWTVAWEPMADATAVRVVVAEDAALIRDGVVRLLTSEGFAVVAEAADYDALLDAVDAAVPDLLVTDIRMPPTNTDEGLRAAAIVRERHPSVAVLLLSNHVEAQAAAALFDGSRGGVGYLLKERISHVDDFVEAARRVAAGGSIVDPTITERMLRRRRGDDVVRRLTERERDVLDLMAQGMSNAAISRTLVLGAKTVEFHVRSILSKLDLPEDREVHRRVQAVLQWLGRSG